MTAHEVARGLAAFIRNEMDKAKIAIGLVAHVPSAKCFLSYDIEVDRFMVEATIDQCRGMMAHHAAEIVSMICHRVEAQESVTFHQFLDRLNFYEEHVGVSGGVEVHLAAFFDVVQSRNYWRVEMQYLVARVLPKIGDTLNVKIPRRFTGSG